MVRRPLAVAGAALLLSLAVGCGGDGSTEQANSTEDYCDSLSSAQKEFGALSGGELNGANLGKIFDRMHSLAGQAPPAVADEWHTLDTAIGTMESGLDELGISFRDLTDPKKLQDVDPKKLQEFGQDMQKLGGRKFQQAGQAIEKHAQNQCGIKLDQQ